APLSCVSARWWRDFSQNPRVPRAHDVPRQKRSANRLKTGFHGQDRRVAHFNRGVGETDGAGFEVEMPRAVVINAFFENSAEDDLVLPNQASCFGDPRRNAQLKDDRLGSGWDVELEESFR